MYLSDYSVKSSSGGHFVGRAVNGRVPFCEPFQATHLQGPGSHPRSCCCATSFSNKFTHNHYTSSLTSLHVAAAFQQPNPPLPNVGIGIVLLLSLLVIHLGPLGSSPSECKSRFREVILHEKSMIDWGLAGVMPSFIVVFGLTIFNDHRPGLHQRSLCRFRAFAKSSSNNLPSCRRHFWSLLLSLLVIHLGPLWSSPSRCKSSGWERSSFTKSWW